MSEARRRREEGKGCGTLFGLLAAFGLLALVVGGSVASYLMTMRQQNQQEKKWKEAAGAIKSLPGKTPDQVIKRIGRPDSTRGDAWKDDYAEWHYWNAVWNRATDRHEETLVVRFSKGKAEAAR